MESSDLFPVSQEENHKPLTCPQPPRTQTPKKKKNKVENKRRFTYEQIKSLECIFESETKLEPRKKVQVASELGLHPRQVSIWFQNRRARWKSKQIEQEYRKLREDYDSLSSQFDSLKKEKESLLIELQKLGDLLGRGNMEKEVFKERSMDGCDSDSGTKPGCSCERLEDREGKHSHGGKRDTKGYLEDKEHQLPRMVDEHIDGPLASLDKWCSGDPSGLLDHPAGNSYWLNFWI